MNELCGNCQLSKSGLGTDCPSGPTWMALMVPACILGKWDNYWHHGS